MPEDETNTNNDDQTANQSVEQNQDQIEQVPEQPADNTDLGEDIGIGDESNESDAEANPASEASAGPEASDTAVSVPSDPVVASEPVVSSVASQPPENDSDLTSANEDLAESISQPAETSSVSSPLSETSTESQSISPSSETVGGSPSVVASVGAFVSPDASDSNANPVVDTPVVSGPIVSDGGGPVVSSASNTSPVASDQPPKKRDRKKMLWFGAPIILVLILAAAYVYAIYLPNTPSGTYARTMDYSNRAYDKLVSVLTTPKQQKHYKSTSIDGKFDLSDGQTKASGTLTGAYEGKNGNAALKVNYGTQKYAFNVRTITPASQTYPDLYLQISGIKDLLDGFGLKQYDFLDSQWVVVDHTLLQKEADASAKTTDNSSKLTQAQLKSLLNQIGLLNRKYLFTTDKSNEILVNQRFLGKPSLDGRQMYEYQMSYNKQNLKAYLDAVVSAINKTPLKNYLNTNTYGSVQKGLSTKNIDSEIDKAKDNYSFKLYVDAKTKLIHQLRFGMDKNPDKNYFAFGQNYTGGNSYPFTFEYHDGADSSGTGDFKVTTTYNSANDQISVNANAEGSDNGTPLKLTASLDVTPSNQDVKVTAPTKTMSLADVLKKLGIPLDLTDTQSSSSAVTKASVQNTLAEIQAQADIYNADNTGSYPTSQAAFVKWLASTSGDNNKILSATLAPGKGYSYSVLPSGCDNHANKCTGYKLTANKSLFGGSQDLIESRAPTKSA